MKKIGIIIGYTISVAFFLLFFMDVLNMSLDGINIFLVLLIGVLVAGIFHAIFADINKKEEAAEQKRQDEIYAAAERNFRGCSYDSPCETATGHEDLHDTDDDCPDSDDFDNDDLDDFDEDDYEDDFDEDDDEDFDEDDDDDFDDDDDSRGSRRRRRQTLGDAAREGFRQGIGYGIAKSMIN